MEPKVRVLHVDDNLMDRLLVKDALVKEHDSFEIVEASNRETFEKHIVDKDFDIILSDFNILGFDGLQVLQLVKEKCPETPVIIVTGTGSEEIAIQAMKMGASDYVIKSVNHIRGLAPTIKMVLENKQAQNERILARAALRKSEEKYRKIFENVQDVFFQINQQGLIEEVSPSIFRTTCYSREELLGKDVYSFSSKSDARETILKILSDKGEIWDFELNLETKSKEIKIVSLNAHFMVDGNNEPIGIEGSMRDITERKQMELELTKAKDKAEESDRLKTSFLQNISHEIRTPLNAIMGFSGLLKDPELSDEKRDQFAEIIIQSSDQLLAIISNIISIATIEAKQEIIHENEIELNSVIKILHNQFLDKAQSQGIDFHFETPIPDSKAIIKSDETKLTEVLTNLIINALKFTKHGHVNFGYKVKNEELEFFVEDTGIGIPKEMHEEIFKRFHQVENSATREFGGSGLGLSISKAYIDLLGGKIWLNSEIKKGSTFYFTVPYKKVDKTNDIYPENILDKNQLKMILIVEDEDSNYNLLVELLKLSDFKIDIIRASNGLEAVNICKYNHTIDLILMDIKMPVMDGYEATLQIRKFMPDVPIIAQTAYISDKDKDKALASGCNDFINKPIKQDILIAKIKEQLSKR